MQYRLKRKTFLENCTQFRGRVTYKIFLHQISIASFWNLRNEKCEKCTTDNWHFSQYTEFQKCKKTTQFPTLDQNLKLKFKPLIKKIAIYNEHYQNNSKSPKTLVKIFLAPFGTKLDTFNFSIMSIMIGLDDQVHGLRGHSQTT